jgi:hypothetical protein
MTLVVRSRAKAYYDQNCVTTVVCLAIDALPILSAGLPALARENAAQKANFK